MKVNLPIIYSQWDSRWAANMLGFNKNLPYNMYNFGCYVTAFAMACRYYGKDTDPGRLNQQLIDLGAGKGFTAGGGDYVPNGVNKIYGDIKELRTVTPSTLTDAQIAEIRTAIDNGYPVLIGIDVSPKTVEYNSHFVAIVDYNPNDENDFTIADPLGGKIQSLKTYLGWYKPNARNTIESYVICTGPKPALGNETIPVLKKDFENLVFKATQHDKTVEYLKPGADPKTTPFEILQTVVAGIKSRQTDLENQLKAANDAKTIAEKEVENQKDKLANITAECQRELEAQKVAFDALKATMPDLAKIEGQYKGIIKKVDGELREAQKAKGIAEKEIVRIQNELDACKKGISAWTQFVAMVKKLLKL